MYELFLLVLFSCQKLTIDALISDILKILLNSFFLWVTFTFSKVIY